MQLELSTLAPSQDLIVKSGVARARSVTGIVSLSPGAWAICPLATSINCFAGDTSMANLRQYAVLCPPGTAHIKIDGEMPGVPEYIQQVVPGNVAEHRKGFEIAQINGDAAAFFAQQRARQAPLPGDAAGRRSGAYKDGTMTALEADRMDRMCCGFRHCCKASELGSTVRPCGLLSA